jgi:hypothetical protein
MMFEYIIMVCMIMALICSIIQLCFSFYDKGFTAGYNKGINCKIIGSNTKVTKKKKTK